MDHQNELQSIKRMLNEIADLCDHASLTGSLSTGAKRVALRYNAVLEQLVGAGDVPNGIFSKVPDDADYGEIGVEARMLAGYFHDSNKKNKHHDEDGKNILIRLAPFIGQDELGMLVREHRVNGSELDMHTLTGLAPFLGQDALSALVREHLRAKHEATPPAPEPPAPKHAVPAEPVAASHAPGREIAPVEEEKKESAGDLLDILKSPYLSEEERLGIIDRIKAIKA